jgi:hypothetical protein
MFLICYQNQKEKKKMYVYGKLLDIVRDDRNRTKDRFKEQPDLSEILNLWRSLNTRDYRIERNKSFSDY